MPPEVPVASIVWLPRFPDRRPRGMVPWQLKVPLLAATVRHNTVLPRLWVFSPLRYVIVKVFPGVNPEPLARTGVIFFPETGVNASWGTDGAGDTGVVTGVTVSTAAPGAGVSESVAVIVVTPSAKPVASPCDPGVFDTVAVLVDDEDQMTESVRSCVLRSE
jgi:hypothetical protein